VNELEERIRDALRADAATVRPESIPGVPPRPPRPPRRGSRRTAGPWSARGRVLVPLAAAAAVGATVVGLTVARPLPGSGRPASGTAVASPSPGRLVLPTISPRAHLGPVPKPVLGPTATRGVPASAPAPGVPPFYVTVNDTSNPNKIIYALFVRSAATGANLVAMGTPPGFAQFEAIAATAGDHTFVVAARPDGATSCSDQLYQFRLGRDGQPGPLVPLHITVPGRFSENGDLAITPDGRTLAYASYLCGKSEGEVGVIDLATRHVSVWATSAASPSPSGLSLSDDGRWLAYDTMPGARLLNTSAPGGPVLAHSKVISKTADWAVLAGDGRSLYGCVVPGTTAPGRNVGTVTYFTQPLTGGGQKPIASWANLPSPECWATPDPSGHYLLVQFPAQAPPGDSYFLRPAVLNIRTGQLTRISEARAYWNPLDVAW
jgi:WD40-like Beta Propeller Repeat